MRFKIPICLLSLHALVLFGNEPLTTSSPDGKLEIALTCNEKGQLSYTFRAEGAELIKASRAGYDNGTLKGTSRRSENALWKPVWGKRAVVPEQYNEMTLDMNNELSIPLAFLGAGDYDAMIIQDGADSDYRTQCESYKVSKQAVKATDTLHVKLAPGGGACVLLKKKR